jgi:hypothetical protein
MLEAPLNIAEDRFEHQGPQKKKSNWAGGIIETEIFGKDATIISEKAPRPSEFID